MKVSMKGFGFYIISIFLILFLITYISDTMQANEEKYGMKDYYADLEAGEIVGVSVYPNEETPTGEVRVVLQSSGSSNSSNIRTFHVTDVKVVEDAALEKGVEVYVNEIQKPNWFLTGVLPYILGFAAIFLMFSFFTNQSSGGGNKMMNFGKSRARMTMNGTTTFKDVAGLIEEKEELREIVDFLSDPAKFTKVGARIPKGILLEGPPGTGKTLLAKAVAGEAKVPFFSISGSDFVEMFVGVGASRVRDLFADAKKNAPCIVFIDEIDAVGRRRGTGMGGGHDEREQTLNQLLVEMDGFGANEGVIVIAATNRPDILDPALLRPGRFDRQVTVGYPDIKGREEILQVHARNKPLAPDVDLHQIAATTVGFTGADLENLLNEAALLAAKRKKMAITMPEIEEATMKVVVGSEKKSRKITDKDKKITAYHEAGHAISSYYLENQDPVTHISIVPRGMAAGFTLYTPEQDKTHMMKSRMLDDIVSLLGGRVAEQIIFNDISTGASNDIQRATEIARNMITKYGMSEKLGPIAFGSDNDEVFLGKNYNHTRNYSENKAAVIDEEVERIVNTAYKRTETILKEHIDQLHLVSEALIKLEKIDKEQFESLMTNGTLPQEKVFETEDETEATIVENTVENKETTENIDNA